MNWYVELTIDNGKVDKLYCTTREEARYLARLYRHYTTNVVKATVRKVESEVA